MIYSALFYRHYLLYNRFNLLLKFRSTTGFSSNIDTMKIIINIVQYCLSILIIIG